jgi:hypothetical protein
MKTKNAKLNPSPETFFFDEAKYNRAVGEMSSYCNSANKILTILKDNEYEITTENAKQALTANLEDLTATIMNRQRNALKSIPETARVQLLSMPNLNAIEPIRRAMIQIHGYNAGFFPSDFLTFAEGKFKFDEPGLREHFTIYRNEKIDELETLISNFLDSWEKLKSHCKKLKFGSILNIYGVIHFDSYSEIFYFNKKSPDLLGLQAKKQA